MNTADRVAATFYSDKSCAPSTAVLVAQLAQEQPPIYVFMSLFSVSHILKSYKIQAKLSYYTFKHDRRVGRRQLGVLPPEVAVLMPEAFSTFTLPVVLPDGSRSRVQGVPNVDFTHLFAHTVMVTQVCRGVIATSIRD